MKIEGDIKFCKKNSGVLLVCFIFLLLGNSCMKTTSSEDFVALTSQNCTYNGILIYDVMHPVYRNVPLYPVFIFTDEVELSLIAGVDSCTALKGILLSPINIDRASKAFKSITSESGKEYKWSAGVVQLEEPCENADVVLRGGSDERFISYLYDEKNLRVCINYSSRYSDRAAYYTNK